MAEAIDRQRNTYLIQNCCNTLLRTLEDRLGFKRAILRLIFTDQRGSLIVGSFGVSDEFAARSAHEDGGDIWKDAAGYGGLLIISDIENDHKAAFYQEIFRKESVKSLLFVPLLTQGEVTAGVDVYGDKAGQFTSADGERLRGAGIFLLEALIGLVFEYCAVHPISPVTDALEGRSTPWGHDEHSTMERLRFLIDRLRVFHELIIENIPIGVLATDAKGYVILMNKELERMSLVGREECLGKRWYEVFGFTGEIREQLETSFRTSTARFFPEIYLPSGAAQPVEMKTDVIRDYSGAILGVIAICSDMTEKKRIEREIEKVERLAAIGKLSSSVAHEIRNPLAGISGALQAIRRRIRADTEMDKVFNRVFEEIVRLNNVVEKLQDLTSPGQMSFGLHPIHAIVDDSIFFIHKLLSKKGIKLTKKLDLGLKPIKMDKSALKQVVLNILINAINSMPDGGSLSVRTRAIGNIGALGPGIVWHKGLYPYHTKTDEALSSSYLAIIVADDGIGIPQTVIPKIFDAFFSTFDGGTGLGLYISSTIVALHGGMIGCRSEEKKGSVFYVLLPATDQ